LGNSFGDGIEKQMIDNIIALKSGHIQITGRPPKKEPSLPALRLPEWNVAIRNAPEVEKLVLEGGYGITGTSRRTAFEATFFAKGRSIPGVVSGIEPDKDEFLRRWLTPVSGSFLSLDNPYGIYVSQAAAERYNLEVGDDMVVVCITADGATNALDLVVVGIYRRTIPWLENVYYLPYQTAHSLAAAEDRVQAINVYLRDTSQADRVAEALQRELDKQGMNLRVQTYREVGDFEYGIALSTKVPTVITGIVLFIIIGAGVMNTVLMAVRERTMEIGTIMALGLRRRQLVFIFLLESIILGIISAALGIAFGSAVVLWLNRVGIRVDSVSFTYLVGGDKLYTVLTANSVLAALFFILFLAVFGTLYPAYLASKKEPVEALRYV
jgi:putative ABC transport system permease protein